MVTPLVTEKKDLLQINLQIDIPDTFQSSNLRLFWELKLELYTELKPKK